MSRSSSERPVDPGFHVEIRRGQRALDVAADAPAVIAPGSRPAAGYPARPAVRPRQTRQQRVLAGVLIVALLLVVAAFAVSWWSAQPPPGVLARVNGEEIRGSEVDQEILLNRALTALLNGKEVAPSRGATVEDLIDRHMKAHDARSAGLTVTDAEVASFVHALITRNGKTDADLDTALQGYGLTRADLLAEQRDIVLINSYIGLKVVADATSDDDRQRRINDWVTQLQRTTKVERFGTPDEPTAPRLGATAPDFKLRDLGGKIVSLSDLHGRPVLLNFWATWCEPCRSELPTIQAAYSRTRTAGPQPGPGLEVLGIAIESDPDIIKSFQQEFGLQFPILPDAAGQLGLKSLYRVGPIPTSFFIDRTSRIRAIKVGMLDPQELTDKLKLIP